jgi:hypothetical protein
MSEWHHYIKSSVSAQISYKKTNEIKFLKNCNFCFQVEDQEVLPNVKENPRPVPMV